MSSSGGRLTIPLPWFHSPAMALKTDPLHRPLVLFPREDGLHPRSVTGHLLVKGWKGREGFPCSARGPNNTQPIQHY